MLRGLKPVLLGYGERINLGGQAGSTGHVKAIIQWCFGLCSQVYLSWEPEPARANAECQGHVESVMSESGRCHTQTQRMG